MEEEIGKKEEVFPVDRTAAQYPFSILFVFSFIFCAKVPTAGATLEDDGVI